MPLIYSDLEIAALIQERKPLPKNWRSQLRPRGEHRHTKGHLDITGDAGNQFRVILRQNPAKPLDFSVILAVRISQSSKFFRLRRYNGHSHEHINHIENTKSDGFHIHCATARYQAINRAEDGYAVPTTRYCDINGAVQCLLNDANFEEPT